MTEVRELRAMRRESVVAAQWLGQDRSTWPDWWSGLSAAPGREAVLLRGNEVESVWPGNWLIRHESGRVSVLTEGQFRARYETEPTETPKRRRK